MNEVTEAPQQLALALPVVARPARSRRPAVVTPLKFRVSEATAQRGLQHVAELRELLAQRQAAREAAQPRRRPVRSAA
jgi:hypothetical protein